LTLLSELPNFWNEKEKKAYPAEKEEEEEKLESEEVTIRIPTESTGGREPEKKQQQTKLNRRGQARR
jgi:hypothetical protein